MRISVSDGVVTTKLSVFALLTTMTFLLRLQFLQVLVQTIESLFPDVAVALGPLGNRFERGPLDAARPPLRITPAGDQPRTLEDPEVLGHRGHAHVERLGELADRALARSEPSQNGPASGIGQGGEGGAQSVGLHG